MAFLTDDDYKDQVQDNILASILGNANRSKAEMKAQGQMTSALNMRFDVAAVFAATGDDRNAEIIMYMIDLTLFHLSSRSNPGQVPELRQNRYDDAMAWLKLVAAGKLDPLLPKPAGAAVDTKSDVQYGSSTPRNPYY